MGRILRGLATTLTTVAMLACGPVVVDDQGTDPAPEEDVTIHHKSAPVYQIASNMIQQARPKATELFTKKVNLVLANNAIFDVIQGVEAKVNSPLTDGKPTTACPYLTSSSASSTISCRYLVDRAAEDAVLSSSALEDSLDREIEQQHGSTLDTAQLAFVKSWSSEAVASGIDVGAVHTVQMLRKMKVCDQAPSAKDKAFKLGESQGKALLEQTEKAVLPTIPKTQCNTDIIAATILAEAKKKLDAFAKANPVCAGHKPADMAEAVDLVKAGKDRTAGLAEGLRQGHEALRVRLVNTWKCDPCLCYTRMGGSGPTYCFAKTDLDRPAKSPWWNGKVGGYRCAPDGATIRQKVEAPCHGYANASKWGGCCGDELAWLAADGVKQCDVKTAKGGAVVIGSPLVLDLDGDGVRLSRTVTVPFDLAATGEPARVPALEGADALLALDLDGNGRIDSGAELFGNASSCGADRCTDGVEALARHDSNRDGVIDRRDRVYRRLRLWRDANHDGVSSPDELLGLRAAGVRSISLAARLDLAWTGPQGSATRALGFTRTDGRAGVAHDVWFNLTFDRMPRDPRTSGIRSTLHRRLAR